MSIYNSAELGVKMSNKKILSEITFERLQGIRNTIVFNKSIHKDMFPTIEYCLSLLAKCYEEGIVTDYASEELNQEMNSYKEYAQCQEIA